MSLSNTPLTHRHINQYVSCIILQQQKKISDFIKGKGEKDPFCLVEQYVKIINLSFQQDGVKFGGD